MEQHLGGVGMLGNGRPTTPKEDKRMEGLPTLGRRFPCRGRAGGRGQASGILGGLCRGGWSLLGTQRGPGLGDQAHGTGHLAFVLLVCFSES